ncbi:GIY-YIG nuclease family protein [Metabacillus fastidiosus]|uniref:GIY-YIG nuclease family protein n=1 Tax=Metabacillus fastidiosus TaxID=1458 RepID=UPI003D2E678F
MFQRILSRNSANGKGSTAVIMQPQKIYLFEPNQAELENIMSSPMRAGKAPGYVYFVQEYMNGSFKIGKTKYVEKRMNVFGVKLPFEHKLVYLIKTGNHHQTEAAFHRHFSDKRLEGEWFALNKEDINWVKKGNYTFKINQSIKDNLRFNNNEIDDSMPLTVKQIQYAKSLIKKLEKEYEFITDYSLLTQKDLNRLSVYFKYKNIGAINNLVKKGVLKLK